MAKITVKDNSGKKITDFSANNEDPISTQAQENGAEVPVACGVGVCGSCKCKVQKGREFIDDSAFGDAQVPLNEDEVLTCISGIKEETPDKAEIEIELENL